MVILGENGQIKLELVETISESLPCATDMCCSIEALCRGFGGRDDTVWFSRESIERFLTDLRRLEATRQGVAALTDYSYGSEHEGVRLCRCMGTHRGAGRDQEAALRPAYTGTTVGDDTIRGGCGSPGYHCERL